MKLEDYLLEYSRSGIYPMHMPGHKRNPDFKGLANPYLIDMTEVPGTDDLHRADGVIKESMDLCAAVYGTDRAFYLINGSSGGLLAAIHAAVPQRGSVLMTRICHRSIYNGLGLREADCHYILPDRDPSYNITVSIRPEEVEEGLKAHPDVSLVIITSPTYEGVISDIKTIAEICHRYGVPLLVDAAHGAHLPFMGDGPGLGRNAGFSYPDIVVTSLHKTLPSPTQTSVLLHNGSLISAEAVQESLCIFETTSPSYILMAGIDNCVRFLAGEERGPAFEKYEKMLAGFDKKIRGCEKVRVFCHGDDRAENHPGVFSYDPGKLVVSSIGSGKTGFDIDRRLLEEYKLQVEAPFKDYVIAMTSVLDRSEGINRFAEAICKCFSD